MSFDDRSTQEFSTTMKKGVSMIKSKEDQQLEQLAKQFRKHDKRLSWETCLRKAKSQLRTFNAKY